MKIAIVGAGAAGMMCAAAIKESIPGMEVVVFEKNDHIGKKVLISGGGRCNVTTGLDDIRQVLSKYPRGGKFLNQAIRAFSPRMVYEWFEKHGVPLKVEKDGRVFPVSDNGQDVVGVFEKLFASTRTKMVFNSAVKKIERSERKFSLTLKNGETYTADAVVFTTGGQAYRTTGSSGDGYVFAEALGHSVTAVAPSLNSFITKEKWPKRLSGVSFAKAVLTAKGAKREESTGSFLFTHGGLSGPAVFALSSHVAFQQYSPEKPLPIFIDLLPDSSAEEIYALLKKSIVENKKKIWTNIVAELVPHSVADVLCEELKIDRTTLGASVKSGDVHRTIDWLKRCPLQAVGRGAGDEFVTAGGISLSEVNPNTMESTICPNVYFAGEILDVDGYTGGFNLQASWATGRLAGVSIVKKSEPTGRE